MLHNVGLRLATLLQRCPTLVSEWNVQVVTLDNFDTTLHNVTGDPLHSRAACTQPCNVNTHSRAHCSPGARLCEQWGHGCVNNGARLCASARLCRGSPVNVDLRLTMIIKSSHSHNYVRTLLLLCGLNHFTMCFYILFILGFIFKCIPMFIQNYLKHIYIQICFKVYIVDD